MKLSGGMDVMKSSDLEEWELVADDDERIINIDTNTSTTSLSHVINYFHYSYCPPPLEFVHKTGPSNQLLLLPPPPPPPPVSIDHLKTMVQPPPPPGGGGGGGGGAWESSISTLEEDHDVSSPKLTSDFNQFGHPCKQVVVVVDPEMDKGITAVKEEEEEEEEDGGGAGGGLFKIWKWSINYNKNSVRIGGAICSFAAICIMSLISCRNINNINNDQTKRHHHFQIYTTTTNDHRQQVVVHRANEALISTGGRIPFIATAARITFGGYYDASASI